MKSFVNRSNAKQFYDNISTRPQETLAARTINIDMNVEFNFKKLLHMCINKNKTNYIANMISADIDSIKPIKTKQKVFDNLINAKDSILGTFIINIGFRPMSDG